MISKFFIERPVLANVLAILMVVIGAVALLRLPVAQYPERGAADHLGDHALSGRERAHRRRHRRAADRAAGQRRRRHDLHAVLQRRRRQLHAHRHLQASAWTSTSRRCWCRTGCPARSRQLPQAVQAQGVTVQQKSTAILQFVTLTSPDDRYDSLFLANYATISLQPSSRGCRASAKSTSSAPASIRCAFGSTPTSSMRAR